MTTMQLLRTAWDFQPSVVIGCLALLALYGWVNLTRPSPDPTGENLTLRGLGFFTGVLILFVALTSPLDVLGDGYLFSAHMAQHLLLVEVVPPLLLLGVSAPVWRRLLAWPAADRLERVLGQPVIGWTTAVVTLWAWHAPGLYNAALADERIHVVQHLSFLVTASMFWWPVIAPLPERRRLPSWAAVGYLMIGALATSILGIVLTFSPVGVYPAYLHPADPLGILPLLRNSWGLSPEADQRLGGGLMWMAGGFVYLLAIVLSVARWFGELDADENVDETLTGQALEPALDRP